MINLLPVLIIVTVWGGSLTIASFFYNLVQPYASSYLSLPVSIFVFVLSYPILAGFISITSQHAIKKGKFERNPLDKVYFFRRIYGVCWTQVFYFKPIYHVFLSVPVLRKILFYLFGYRGQIGFTLYPDTWIRDLPILKLGDNSYISNKTSLGTNMPLQDGTILVDGISIGKKTVIGHLGLVAPGAKFGEDAELGATSVIGIRSKVGNKSRIGVNVAIHHGVLIDENVEVGGQSSISLRSHIHSNIKIPAGTNIPPGSNFRTQEELDVFLASLRIKLETKKDVLVNLLFKNYTHGS